MPAKSARDFQAFRVLSYEMTMCRGLECVAMRSTPCNRVILTVVRHPMYVLEYVIREIFRICTLFANSLSQPQVHLTDSRDLFFRPFPHIPLKPISWTRYLVNHEAVKERRENSDDKENYNFSRWNFKIANRKISVNVTSQNFWA